MQINNLLSSYKVRNTTDMTVAFRIVLEPNYIIQTLRFRHTGKNRREKSKFKYILQQISSASTNDVNEC